MIPSLSYSRDQESREEAPSIVLPAVPLEPQGCLGSRKNSFAPRLARARRERLVYGPPNGWTKMNSGLKDKLFLALESLKNLAG